MKIHIQKTTTVSVLVIGVLFFVAMVTFVVYALSRPAHAVGQDGKLITVHDRGKETTFLTKQETLGEALKEADIELTQRDAVEPAVTEKLVASDYQVNIYRARPVTVVDGPTRLKVLTPYQTVDRIASDAGISLHPEDTATIELSKNILDGAGLEMTIDRATLVTVDLYGKSTPLRTQAETVGDMLKEKHIDLGSAGRVSPSSTTRISEGLAIRVWREGKQTVTADVAIPFETEQVRDADRSVDYKKVETPGKNGTRSVTYEVVIKDGVEVSRTEIASVTTSEPVKQVETIGTKPNTLPYTGGGSKTEWLAASNIPEEFWGYADFMVAKESGWNPNAVNRSSGACGLAQALPCSKVPGNPYNPVDSLNWMNNYVNGRYGGWAGAYSFWQTNRWY